MKILENLELVNVEYDDKKAVLTFLDEEAGEVREVNFNKKSYDATTNSYVDDEEKAEKVDKWCDEHFGLAFEKLPQAIGTKKDIYVYDKFNSVFPVDIVDKFPDDMVGEIFDVVVTDANDDGIGIKIRFNYEDKTYESKMNYAEYMEVRKQWFVNPQKQVKQYEKFEEKFGFPVTEIERLIGETITVEIKKAMGKWVWVEVKKFNKSKLEEMKNDGKGKEKVKGKKK